MDVLSTNVLITTQYRESQMMQQMQQPELRTKPEVEAPFVRHPLRIPNDYDGWPWK